MLKDVCKVAIVGDWGTGQDRADLLLRAPVAAQKPDVFIHLGDIYYSGTSDEMADNYLAVCRKVLPKSVPIFTLCGNHDVYAGGRRLRAARRHRPARELLRPAATTTGNCWAWTPGTTTTTRWTCPRTSPG